jgi:Lon protease-like protein
MIQPHPDDKNETGLCRTGCAGRITQYRETSDGRIEMVLSGVCRYDLGEELPTTRGYRLIVPNWSRFSADYANHEDELRGRHELLVQALKRYFELKQLEVNWSVLQRLSTERLMDSLIMALPLGEQDKQVLLETVEAAERLETFIVLLNGELDTHASVTRH